MGVSVPHFMLKDNNKGRSHIVHAYSLHVLTTFPGLEDTCFWCPSVCLQERHFIS